MINHIALRNFQAWRALDVDLAPITMFVGKGDGGKSAIIRAITYALTNKGGEDFIRQGAKEAKVLLAMGDDQLLWLKPRGKGAVYHTVIDGVDLEYTKTGQTVPEEIVQHFGFRPIEVEKGTTFWPQLHQQFDPPFLVFESGGKVAKAIGSITKLDVFLRAQHAGRKEMDAALSTSAAAKARVEQLTQQWDRLPDTDEARDRYDRIERELQRADEARAQAAKAREAVQAHRSATAAARAATRGAAVAQAHEEATAAVERAREAGLALRSYREHVATRAAATELLAVKTSRLTELAEEYEHECRKRGVCDQCPWR